MAAFCLDLTEVTVKAYSACYNDNLCSAPGGRQHSKSCNWERRGRSQHPINCIDWHQALAVCEYAGKRLPTNEEWQWAAQNGDEATTYPWGNHEPTPDLLNAFGPEGDPERGTAMWDVSDGFPETSPVGSFPWGANHLGVLDLAGNVWEWTATTEDYSRGIRGGSWLDGEPATFQADMGGEGAPSMRTPALGVRCAKSR